MLQVKLVAESAMPMTAAAIAATTLQLAEGRMEGHIGGTLCNDKRNTGRGAQRIPTSSVW